MSGLERALLWVVVGYVIGDIAFKFFMAALTR